MDKDYLDQIKFDLANKVYQAINAYNNIEKTKNDNNTNNTNDKLDNNLTKDIKHNEN